MSENLRNVRFASGTVLEEKVMVKPLGMGDRGHIPALTNGTVKLYTSPSAPQCLCLLVCKMGRITELHS